MRPGPMPRKLRVYDPIQREILVEGSPKRVARWHVGHPPTGQWDRRRVVQRPTGTNGTWTPLHGAYATWWGNVIVNLVREVKHADLVEVEAAAMSRRRGVVKSSPVPKPPTQKEANKMASTKTKKGKKNRKAAEAEVEIDDEELEGLEEELDDDDEDEEEPDVVDEDEDEDEDDDEEEEEAPKAKRSKKGKSKKSRSKKASSNGKAKKSSKKGKGKKSKKGGAKPGTKTSDMGGVGTSEVAEAAGVSPRELRVFLRRNEEKYPKDDEVGRYRWPSLANKTVKRIIKEVQASQDGDDE